MRMSEIGEIVGAVPKWDPRKQASGSFTYVDLSSIDQQLKKVVRPASVEASEAPSRARQIIGTGDVLVSTVRPNLNAVAHVPAELDGATASTGFCVLRPSDDELDSRYLFHWVQSDRFVEEMVRRATGASYPAVSDRIVKESTIPLPPVEEQRRIAAILDAADSLRAKRRQAIAKLGTLTQAIFIDMFGDLANNTKDWSVMAVADFVQGFETGKSIAAGVDAIPGGFRVLKVSAVTSRHYRASESKPVPRDYQPLPHHIVQSGDLLFSRANTTELVGACAYVHETPGNHLLPDKLWRFVWRKPVGVEPLYLWKALQDRRIRTEIGNLATGSSGSMKNISQTKLMGLEIPIPPLDVQQRFVTVFDEVGRLRSNVTRGRTQLDTLFSSLQQRAFRGDV